jgi:hypothetical protein
MDSNTLDLSGLINHYDFMSEKKQSDYLDMDVLPMPRKGKRIIKRQSHKISKKNKIRQNGYNDKLYTIDTNLPSIFTVWDNQHCDSRGDFCYCDDENRHNRLTKKLK